MGPATEKIRLATFDCYGTLIDWEEGYRRRCAAPLRSASRTAATKGGRGRVVGFVTLP